MNGIISDEPSASEIRNPRVAVVGAGPAGLIAAEVLAAAGAAVTVYERMPSAGRRLLMAGRGGLNLTHSEDFEKLVTRYGSAATRLRPALEAFPPMRLREWSAALGQPTFVGSSGRVFPAAFKASPLLRAWLKRLDSVGVRFAYRHEWRGWNSAGELVFDVSNADVVVRPDAVLLALGGASWPRLGADGRWVSALSRAGVAVAPLRPSNCGFVAGWSERFRTRFAGQPLKRIAVMVGAAYARGEAIITEHGLEGGAIYALSAPLRDAIEAHGEALLRIDLRPDLESAALVHRLETPRGKQSFANVLRKTTGLSAAAIGLLQEVAIASAEPLAAQAPAALATLIKSLPIRLAAAAPIGRAISTAGGVSFEELDDDFMLVRRPGTFLAGEMLDWEAPTGGYLLQACFATGMAAARGALRWLEAAKP